MLGDSLTSSSSAAPDAAIAVASEAGNRHDAAIGGDVAGEENSGEENERGRGGGGGDDGDRSFGGNRWPRQETLALLKIRSEMDVAFRDASVKGPLWEQVSRKLGELGYHRSAKKCKEKFENVYKYHKRTKEVRSGKPDSKTYKFFEQLEALDNHPPNFHPHLPKLPPPPPTTVAAPLPPPPPTTVVSHIPSTVPSPAAPPHLMNISFSQPNPTIHLQSQPPPPPVPLNPTNLTTVAPFLAAGFHSIEADLISNSTSDDVEESTSSDEASRRRKRKRKWKDFFERLMREVIQKQEEMQKRFLEAIEKREQERVAREEAWRVQEMAKINREREILAQERSMAAAKDAAITSFLQKITEGQQQNNNTNPPSQPPLRPPPPPLQQQLVIPTSNPSPAPPPPPPASTLQVIVANSSPQKVVSHNEMLQLEIVKTDHNGGESYSMSPASSSSRWPKVEVEALIKLRTNLEAKYQENGPKGPLWEEISSAMKKLGYNRNPKRCKEKWENINKYFKKVKESKKTRPEDSKTCPYFHQLDALYREKSGNNGNNVNNSKLDNIVIGSSTRILQHQQQPLMVRPEQQWPPQQELARPDSGNEEMESEPMDRDDKDEDDEDDDDEEGGGNYEIVASKPASVSAAE